METTSKFTYTFPSTIREDADGIVGMEWPSNVRPFGFPHIVRENDVLNTIQGYSDALSIDECDAVIDIGEGMPRSDGKVDMAAESYRVSHIAWIEPNDATAWIYHKVGALFARASRHYGFELIGLADALQYTVYGPGQHFNWHMDLGPAITSTRKLSMTIQLSDPQEYTGGELQFLNASPVGAMGTAICFPSFMAHRVAPVVTGTRRSLVAWANGPAFR